MSDQSQTKTPAVPAIPEKKEDGKNIEVLEPNELEDVAGGQAPGNVNCSC